MVERQRRHNADNGVELSDITGGTLASSTLRITRGSGMSVVVTRGGGHRGSFEDYRRLIKENYANGRLPKNYSRQTFIGGLLTDDY